MRIIQKIAKVFAGRSMSAKIKYLRKQGARIGNHVMFTPSVNAFGSEPYLVEIGDHCILSYDIRFITHDGATGVYNHLHPQKRPIDKLGKITVGNNVFVGAGTYIMPGVTIGSNVIIGAKSTVTKDVPDNCVIVGSPAKVVMTVDEYCAKLEQSDMIFETWGIPQSEKRKICIQAGLIK